MDELIDRLKSEAGLTEEQAEKALETIKTIGHNEYLEDLITMLIHRDR